MPRPGGPYGVSKLAATELVLGSGLDAVVLRVFSPVGPGTPAGSPLGRLAEAMRRAMQSGDGELKLGGLGVQRDFVDVRDVARAVHAASLSAAQGVVNIGSGPRRPAARRRRRPRPGRRLRRRPARARRARPAGRPSARPRTSATRAAEPDHAGPDRRTRTRTAAAAWQQADVRTARDRLGWRPRINLEESLADIWMEAACRI